MRILQFSGIYGLSRRMTAGRGRILMYHNFSGPGQNDPDALNLAGIRAQFDYLRRHFRVVSLYEMAARVASQEPMQPFSVALTIDDGRRNCYQDFFPLLKEFGFAATFFVVSSFIDGTDWIWTDKVMWLSEKELLPELKRENLESTFQKLNRMPPDLRNAEITAMSTKARVLIPETPPAKYAACTWDELREMADAGSVEIGSHSVDHPIFSTISETESWRQLTDSRARIESALGRKVRCFCFPNGMPGDYRESQLQQVRDAGYECAVVAEPGLVHPGSDPFRMHRIGMGRKRDTLEIGKYLDGVSHFAQKTRRYFTSAPQ